MTVQRWSNMSIHRSRLCSRREDVHVSTWHRRRFLRQPHKSTYNDQICMLTPIEKWHSRILSSIMRTWNDSIGRHRHGDVPLRGSDGTLLYTRTVCWNTTKTRHNSKIRPSKVLSRMLSDRSNWFPQTIKGLPRQDFYRQHNPRLEVLQGHSICTWYSITRSKMKYYVPQQNVLKNWLYGRIGSRMSLVIWTIRFKYRKKNLKLRSDHRALMRGSQIKKMELKKRMSSWYIVPFVVISAALSSKSKMGSKRQGLHECFQKHFHVLGKGWQAEVFPSCCLFSFLSGENGI